METKACVRPKHRWGRIPGNSTLVAGYPVFAVQKGYEQKKHIEVCRACGWMRRRAGLDGLPVWRYVKVGLDHGWEVESVGNECIEF